MQCGKRKRFDGTIGVTEVDSNLDFSIQTDAPSPPSTGKLSLFARDGVLKTVDSLGTISEVQSGAGFDQELNTSDDVTFNKVTAGTGIDILAEIASNTTLANTKLPRTGGVMSGNIEMSGNSIFTTLDPATANSLTRRQYVNDETTATELLVTANTNLANTKLPLQGGTLTGSVTLLPTFEVFTPSPPSNINALTNRNYVDTEMKNQSTILTARLNTLVKHNFRRQRPSKQQLLGTFRWRIHMPIILK
jgi:hypothetical protein